MITIGAFLLGAVLTIQGGVDTAAQVDTYPLGASWGPEVANTAAGAITVANHALIWFTGYSDEAVQNDYFSVQDARGQWHFGCTVEVDEPTSHMICGDGFHEES